MEKRFRELHVSDVMSGGVISCTPATPLRTVARLMAAHRVHGVFVFEDGDLWGLVSDLDLVASAWAGIESRTAADAAVAPLVHVSSSDALEYAAQLMAQNGVSHLAVLDPHTHLPIGVVSTLDIAGAIANDRPRTGRLFELFS